MSRYIRWECLPVLLENIMTRLVLPVFHVQLAVQNASVRQFALVAVVAMPTTILQLYAKPLVWAQLNTNK